MLHLIRYPDMKVETLKLYWLPKSICIVHGSSEPEHMFYVQNGAKLNPQFSVLELTKRFEF